MFSDIQDWKLQVKKLYPYKNAVLILLLFIGGLVISLYSNTQTSNTQIGIFWEILGKIGIFLSAVVAVSFIYNIYSRSVNQELFLADMKSIVEKSLKEYTICGNFPKIHESGRLTIQDKVLFLKDIKEEYLELGIAMRTFVSYFTQRPDNEFKNEIETLLQNGVNFKFFLLNPDSKIAKDYAKERRESELLNNIKKSKIELLKLKNEFKEKQYPGKFEIYYYNRLPYFSLTLVDKDSENGKIMISNYLPISKRADMPVIETTKKANTELFEKYMDSLNILIENSQKIE